MGMRNPLNKLDTTTVGWILLALLILISLLFYGWRAHAIYCEQARLETPPILKLIVSGILVIMSFLGFIIAPAPLWLALLRFVALLYALLFSYSANIWIVTGYHHHLTTSKIFLVMTGSALIIIISAYLSRENLGLIFQNEDFKPTLVYYVHYYLVCATLLFMYVLIIRLFWISLRQSKDLTYIVRRTLGLTTYTAAALCVMVSTINLTLSVFYGDMYRHQLNRIFYMIVPVLGLMPIINIVPQPVLAKIVQPLEHILVKRRERQQALLRHLHGTMVKIVPGVQLQNEALRDLHMLIEISDARQMIWSQTQRTKPIAAKDEAQHLFTLCKHDVVIIGPGRYLPPPTRCQNIMQHNVAVAKHLKQLESSLPSNPMLKQV